MLRASALFYAVTVSLLAAMVTGSLMLLVNFRNVETERWLALQRATADVRSAVRLALASDDMRPTTPRSIDLFGNGEDSVTLLVRPYGLLDLAEARARAGDRWVGQQAFIGGRKGDPHVLVLGKGDMSAVHLCGGARLLGDVVVPGGDVRRGYIEGRPFTGERLVEGAVEAASSDIPAPDATMLQRMMANCRRWPAPDERTTSLSALPIMVATPDPFASLPTVDLSGMSRLAGLSLTGPVVLRSSDTLLLDRDLQLDMVVVQAPYIIIGAGADLTVQCFAEQGIHVKEGARLRYPSALVLMPGPESKGTSYLAVDSGAVVEGAVIAGRDPAVNVGQVQVTLAKGSLVRGEVFAQDLLEHRGTVKGTACAGALMLHTASSTYRGYLMDGILAPADPGIAVGGFLLGEPRRTNVLQWIPSTHPAPAAF